MFPADSSRPSHRKARQIALVFLLLATVSLSFFLSRNLLIKHNGVESEQLLQAFESALLTAIDKYVYFPAILTADPRFQRMLRRNERDDDISELLNRFNQAAGSDEIFIMNAEGLTLASSNYRDATSFVGHSYAFRPYYADAIAGRTGFYYAVGVTTGKAGLFISAPIRDNTGRILGVTVVKLDLTPQQASWAATGNRIFLSGPNDIIFLASDPAALYRALRPLEQRVTAELKVTKQYGSAESKPLPTEVDRWSDAPIVEVGGARLLLYSRQVVGQPWRMHRATPVADVNTMAALISAACGGAVLLLIVLALYYREARQKRRAEHRLLKVIEESDAHQRAIIQNTDAGLMTLNERMEIREMNQKAAELFGVPAQAEGASLDPRRLVSPWISAPDSEVREAEGVRPDGVSFPILYCVSLIRTGPDREYLLTVHDVSELKAAQASLLQANEELEARVEERTQALRTTQEALMQERKLAAMGRMSAAIAHELNQPLTALVSYVAMGRLYLEQEQKDKSAATLDKMDALVQRIARISSQLKSFAGIRSVDLRPTALQAVMRYVEEVLEHKLNQQKSIIRMQIPDGLQAIADQHMLEQVMINLLDNAIAAVKSAVKPDISVAAERCGDRVMISVRDNGEGMDEERLRHLFDPFFTTKTGSEGLGLGLAISYNLLQDMHGEITVTSTPGEGSEFTLSLPAVKQHD
ncbi:Signal transduction histidine kinase regulating C4-dicarboxylate transport system [Hahella chejuensis KCTC 2396]|uniref:C4-dicarboxylate transport sensor protein DctB n=1 Tax=Hahella chejuensis (strain KCTC 2396) TaxID=349521 RepID=Q2SNG0_HAHCH|nr:ATP-binding protein [Hahella chejuensis]ABC27814.1 Signal transduction histidine kinase regulating C4-dicarboxylate transport system [Hahella chejuensis KCTC 2396]